MLCAHSGLEYSHVPPFTIGQCFPSSNLSLPYLLLLPFFPGPRDSSVMISARELVEAGHSGIFGGGQYSSGCRARPGSFTMTYCIWHQSTVPPLETVFTARVLECTGCRDLYFPDLPVL